MKHAFKFVIGIGLVLGLLACSDGSADQARVIIPLNNDWRFVLGDDSLAIAPAYDDVDWRLLNLPHDWSIEGPFDAAHSTTQAGGALPAGIGWYRKTFTTSADLVGKYVRIEFDGVYQHSKVWLNGHFLGERPFGYISFEYDLTPYLNPVGEDNVMAVRVDNQDQPNSRWYTGSGIYRKVRLVAVNGLSVGHWGTFVTTPLVDAGQALVNLEVRLENRSGLSSDFEMVSTIYDGQKRVVSSRTEGTIQQSEESFNTEMVVPEPLLWSPEHPHLYHIVTRVYQQGRLVDNFETPLGIRYFEFDAEKGFFLNGAPLKILGACLHHDLGALGAAYNRRANQRQLEIMKAMGANAIRTAHNPFDPEFYALCDEMGFLVMDEAFDVWKLRKARRDYHLFFDEWYERDLRDVVLRTRNHPSVFMYSIGNEIREQFDSTGLSITPELVRIVKEVDPTRPVTCALTENQPELNFIAQSGALDVLGFNYKHEVFDSLMHLFPGQKILASENVSGLATRGSYNRPSDSIRVWPEAHGVPLVGANEDYTVSAYDHVYAYWGSTHADTWRMVKKHDYVSGVFIWTGFDYIGEPTPYPYPARSSYFGVVDLAGFPKDSYYMYQSEWSEEAMLHVFPHWNWTEGELVDVWAYYSQADEVELFLNDRSLGIKSKEDDDFHVMWRVPFESGVIRTVSRINGKEVLVKEVQTAGAPARIELVADRSQIKADGEDLSFVTVKVVDEQGIVVPNADHLIHFEVDGSGFLAGVDNGYPASLESFKVPYRKAFNGLCLAILQNDGSVGDVRIKARSEGLGAASLVVSCN
jgi:beta-galactosidase